MSLRKIALSTMSLVVVAAMSACSNSTMTPSVASVKATSDLSFVSNIKPGTFDPVTNSTFVADVGNGKKGANITVTLIDGSSFNTKASSHGIRPGIFANIANIQLRLNKGGTPFATPAAFATSFSGATKAFTFANVPTGLSYTVDVVAVTDGSAVDIFGSSLPGTSVDVDAANQLSSLTSITATLQLKNGVGASIGADVTATNGASTTGPVTAS